MSGGGVEVALGGALVFLQVRLARMHQQVGHPVVLPQQLSPHVQHFFALKLISFISDFASNKNRFLGDNSGR